jgi:hypothetical protein
MDDDDNEKSVGWFRKGLKAGAVAGGIAGFVLGGVMVGYDAKSAKGEYTVNDIIVWAKILGGTPLAGVIGGGLLGVVVEKLMKGRSGFVPAAIVAGAVGGVIGAVGVIGIIILTNW